MMMLVGMMMMMMMTKWKRYAGCDGYDDCCGDGDDDGDD